MTATTSTPTPASTPAPSPDAGTRWRRSVEACDDGNEVNTDACLNDSRPPPAATTSCGPTSPRVKRATKPVTTATADTDGCRNSCVIARCGDGVVREGVEGCDDGNNVNTDARLDSCALARCGDGGAPTSPRALTAEACDDGNQNNNDSAPTAAPLRPVAARATQAGPATPCVKPVRPRTGATGSTRMATAAPTPLRSPVT